MRGWGQQKRGEKSLAVNLVKSLNAPKYSVDLECFCNPQHQHGFCEQTISHVLNKQGTGYELSIWIEFKNRPCRLKKRLKISKLLLA